MKDYYKVLKLSKYASSFKIFKEFRSKYLLKNLDPSERSQILTAFIILQESSRKFYDIALQQHIDGVRVNPKYISIIKRLEEKAKDIEKDEDRINKIEKILKKFPLAHSIIEFFSMMIFQVSIGWIALGIFLFFISLVFTAYYISEGNLHAIFVTSSIMFFSIFIHNYGILKYRKEEIEYILSK